MMKFSVSNFCIEIEAHTDMRKRHLTCITICLRIIKGTAFLTISEFRRFGLATRRDAVLQARAFLSLNVFTIGRRDAKYPEMTNAGESTGVGQGRAQAEERDKKREGEGGSEKEEHLTLCLAACRTQLIPMLRQRIPVARRALINVSRVCW